MVNGMGIREIALKRGIALLVLGLGVTLGGLHAADHRALVGGQFHGARQEASGQPALREGDNS